MSLAREHIIYIFQLFMEIVFSGELQRDKNSGLLGACSPFRLTSPFFSQELMLGCVGIQAAIIPDQGQAGMPSKRCWSSQLSGRSLASRSSLDGVRSIGCLLPQLRSIAQVAEEETDAGKASIFYGRLIRISPASPQEEPQCSNY